MSNPDAARPIRARATEAHGSNAGAGSGTLALYRKHRRTELSRIEQMEKEREEEEKLAAAIKMRETNAVLDEAKVEKNRRKRMRRKGGGNNKKPSEDGEKDEESDSSAGEGQQPSMDEAQALAELAEAELAAVKELSSE